MHAVDVVDEDYLVEALFFLLSQGILQVFSKGSESCGFFRLLEHLGVLMFLVLFECDSIALQKLRMDVLQIIHLAVNDFLVLLERFFEVVILPPEVKILTVPDEAELLLFLVYEFDVIFDVLGEFLEIVGALFLGVVKLLVDELFNEGVDVGLQEEGVFETRLPFGDPVVEAPHPEAEEGFLQSYLSHSGFVLPIEGDLFFEVVDNIFVGVGIEDEVEELPEVEIVLQHAEYLLLLWVLLVLGSEETRKLVVVVVDIVLVLAAGVVKTDVAQDVELLLLLGKLLAVRCEVADFPLDEALQVGGVDPRGKVELGVEVLPLRAFPAQLLVALAHLFVLVGEQTDAEDLIEGIDHSHFGSLLDAPQVEVLSDGCLAVAEDVEEEL